MRTIDQDDFGEALDSTETVVGGIVITKVIKEHTSIVAREGEESTLGEIVDRQLAQLAVNGDTIQDVALDINPEYWETTLGRFYRDRVAPQWNILSGKPKRK